MYIRKGAKMRRFLNAGRLIYSIASAVVAIYYSVAQGYDLSKVHFEEIPPYGIQIEIDICEANPSCGGVIFRPNQTGKADTHTESNSLPSHEASVYAPKVWPEEDLDSSSQEIPEFLDENGNVVDTSQIDAPSLGDESGREKEYLDEDQANKKDWIGMTKLLFVPNYYNANHDDVYVSHKEWLIMRGSVTVPARDFKSAVLKTETHITIEEAREYCHGHPTCVAFSFPLQTKFHRGMTPLVDEVVFVNQISGFDFGPASYVQEYEFDEKQLDKDPNQVEWFTHVIHDREKLTGRVKKHINIDDAKWREFSTTPYRPCCQAAYELPTIEQVQELDTLQRIPCNISRHEFYENFEKTRTPVMLVGCDKEWPAHEKWKDVPTLLRRFNNASKWDVPREMTWAEFQEYYLKSVKEEKAGFRVFSQLKPGYSSAEIHKDYSVPQPFQGADIYSMLPNYESRTFPQGYGPMHWFIMGSFGTGTGPHIDPHTTDAWNTLVHGHKWWIIYPKRPRVITESETSCYVPCSDHHVRGSINGGTEKSWYSSVGRHVHKMYYGHDETAIQVLQSPGETIYLPFGMVHAVLNMDDTIAVTQNYGAPGNFEEVWHEVLSIGDDVDWKHLYYKRFDRETRKRVREIVWPITERKRFEMRPNHDLYESVDAPDMQSFSAASRVVTASPSSGRPPPRRSSR